MTIYDLLENLLDIDPETVSNKIMHRDSLIKWILIEMKEIGNDD